MKTAHRVRAGVTGESARKHRPRAIPKWLERSTEIEAIARSRCLMVLSVLSGETPVTDAIEQAKIARATYYKLESRALNAMLGAMNPLASPNANGAADLSAAMGQIGALEAKLKRLEQEKRRAERLLLLTRKTIRAPLTTGRRGRWPKATLDEASNPTTPGGHSP